MVTLRCFSGKKLRISCRCFSSKGHLCRCSASRGALEVTQLSCHCWGLDSDCVCCRVTGRTWVEQEGKESWHELGDGGSRWPHCSAEGSFPSQRGQREGEGLGSLSLGKTGAPLGQLFLLLSVLIACSACSRKRLKQNRGLCAPPGPP